jgi:hypothetical protein
LSSCAIGGFSGSRLVKRQRPMQVFRKYSFRNFVELTAVLIEGFRCFLSLLLKTSRYYFEISQDHLLPYCGVFTPCKNRNLETRSRDYATVDEAVFSPCRAELCRVVLSRAWPRIASLRLACCQATAINTWMTQEWGEVTWSRQQWRHAFQQWRNSRSTVGRSISRVADQGFLGETEACSRGVLVGRQPWRVRSWRRCDRVIRSDRFQLSEGVQSSRLRVQVISEVNRRTGKFVVLWRFYVWIKYLILWVTFGVWTCGCLCVEIRC